jgi:hypothetical protein
MCGEIVLAAKTLCRQAQGVYPMFQQSQASLMATLTSQIAVIATSCHVHLYSNNYTPTNQSAVSNFTEADFTGYAAIATTGFSTPSWQSQGAAVAWSEPMAIFNTASPYTVGQTIYGYWVDSGTMTPVLIGAERFTAPVSMIAVGNQIIVSAPLSVADALIPGTIF